jgi:hypothetical protein
MRADRAIVRSVNEPKSSRQSYTPRSINEPTKLSDIVGKPPPKITSLDPGEAAIGDETFTLVVSGDFFFPGTTINFAGYDEPTTHISNDAVSTIVNMDYWHGPDAIPVFVHNGETLSNEMIFTFLPPVAARSEKAKTDVKAAALDIDYTDPDEMEEELEAARDEGDIEPPHPDKSKTKKKR